LIEEEAIRSRPCEPIVVSGKLLENKQQIFIKEVVSCRITGMTTFT